VPAAAGARTHIRVGIGDQHVAMFGQPAFTALKLRRARLFRVQAPLGGLPALTLLLRVAQRRQLGDGRTEGSHGKFRRPVGAGLPPL
jgi:hypothetical protein